jgi:hypothetical protein
MHGKNLKNYMIFIQYVSKSYRQTKYLNVKRNHEKILLIYLNSNIFEGGSIFQISKFLKERLIEMIHIKH